MNEDDKNHVIKGILECIEEAVNIESDDSDKEDILIGLLDLCKTATHLPTNKLKRKWIKSCRKVYKDRGGFLTTELLLTNDACYNNYLGMSKTQFEVLLNLIKRDITRANTPMRDAITPAEKLAITLRFLATGESFRSIEQHTRVSCPAICAIVPEVCRSIKKRLHETYLKFPSSPSEWKTIAKEFNEILQFPHCLGALGEKHINFRARRDDVDNYNGSKSIILMALVDANGKFIYVENSLNNEAGLFNQSSLKKVLEHEKQIPRSSIVDNGRCLPYVVVGDVASPIETYLIKAYPRDIDSKDKQVFNARLLRVRQVVEHSFSILVNRFRVFMSPLNLKVGSVEAVTYACCILHNFILQSDNTYINSIPRSTVEVKDNNSNSTYSQRNSKAETVRQQFTEYFNTEGNLN